MGREKALIRVGGRPLVLHVAGLLEEACAPVLLAPGRRGRLGFLGYPEVEDDVPGAGPLGGLVAGLSSSPHELLAAVGVDMPFASPATLSLLAAIHVGEDAVVPVTRSGPQPLHAVYSASALPKLRAHLAGGHLALRSVLSELSVRWVEHDEWDATDPSGRFAVNVNTEEDVALLGDHGTG
jgi:molybdopterin-guanine dinucleotide biosynthesis protein A